MRRLEEDLQQLQDHKGLAQRLTKLLMMNKYIYRSKKMIGGVFNHALEIISLLTGEVLVLQPPSNSLTLTDINDDKKKTEMIFNHALEIIYLLTGEEYIIVKKNPTHSNLHQKTGECNIDVHNEMVDENCQSLKTLRWQSNRSSDLQNETVATVSEEGDNKIDGQGILRVTIHSELSAGPSTVSRPDQEEVHIRDHQQVKEEEIPVNLSRRLNDESICNLSTNEKEEYEREEKDNRKLETYSDPQAGPYNVKPSVVLKIEQCEMNIRIKEENIPVNISVGLHDEDLHSASIYEEGEYKRGENNLELKETHPDTCTEGFLNKNTTGRTVIRDVDRKESYEVSTVNTQYKHENVNKELNSDKKEGSLTKPYLFTYTTSTSEEEANVCMKKLRTETTQATVNHKDILIMKNHFSEYGGDSLSNKCQQQKYACSECGKCFSQEFSLFRHGKTHFAEKPFLCTACGKSFSQKFNLVQHEKSHVREQPFICSKCGKGFSYMSKLVYHERIHTSEKPFVCSKCGRGFNCKSHLASHEITHSSYKPFACSTCGLCFRQKSALIRHERNHTDLRPYACSECGKCFSQEADLIKHEENHKGLKPFACSECGRGFRRKGDLGRHERYHKGLKPYACTKCGKCFSRRSYIIYHQRVSCKPLLNLHERAHTDDK
ncbi:uncharacterized protein O3C94_015274 [Discoglossus pictus]